MVKKKPADTFYFSYCNSNPKDRTKTGDCVIRAIALATDQTWETVFEGLSKVALTQKRMLNEHQVFEKYLSSLGWVKMPCVKNKDGNRVRILELSKMMELECPILFSIYHHLSYFKDGKVFDTWDCGEGKVGRYYIKKEVI